MPGICKVFNRHLLFPPWGWNYGFAFKSSQALAWDLAQNKVLKNCWRAALCQAVCPALKNWLPQALSLLLEKLSRWKWERARQLERPPLNERHTPMQQWFSHRAPWGSRTPMEELLETSGNVTGSTGWGKRAFQPPQKQFLVSDTGYSHDLMKRV